MVSSHKTISLCLCLMLASAGILVESQSLSSMMGMFGGGGHGHGLGGLGGGFGGGKHGSSGIEFLLAAGLLGKILSKRNHHGHHEGRSAGQELAGQEYAVQQPMQLVLPYALVPEMMQGYAGLWE